MEVDIPLDAVFAQVLKAKCGMGRLLAEGKRESGDGSALISANDRAETFLSAIEKALGDPV